MMSCKKKYTLIVSVNNVGIPKLIVNNETLIMAEKVIERFKKDKEITT